MSGTVPSTTRVSPLASIHGAVDEIHGTPAGADDKRNYARHRLFWEDCIRRAPNLSIMSRLVGITISRYVNDVRQIAYPSQGLMAVELGVTTRTIANAVEELRANHWIAVERPNKRASNVYRLLDTHVDGVEEWYQDQKERLNEARDMKRASRQKTEQRNAASPREMKPSSSKLLRSTHESEV